MSDKTIPTWGYHPAQEARIFDLAIGEALPDGWSPAPLKGQHPHDKELGILPDPVEPTKKRRGRAPAPKGEEAEDGGDDFAQVSEEAES